MRNESMGEPSGEMFSRVYMNRGAPAQDSRRFRQRLLGYLQTNLSNDWYSLSKFLRREGGFDIFGNGTGFEKFLMSAPINEVLDLVTGFWRFVHGDRDIYSTSDNRATKWVVFVDRALREENLGYRVDAKGGVHYFVDEEFERNRVSALRSLDAAPYGAVRHAFEQSHSFLDPNSRDTKASVRAAFEALEILMKLKFPEQKNLNKWVVLNKLKPAAQAGAIDDTERAVVSLAFDGLGEMIDGLHLYRHGQKVTEPVAPTLGLTVFYLSIVAAALRWMVVLPSGSPAVATPPPPAPGA